MLIRSTCSLIPGFHFITFGDACFYLLNCANKTILFDCGLPAHVSKLKLRLEALEEKISKIDILLVTNLSAARIGGLPQLRTIFPDLKLWAPTTIQTKLNDGQFIEELYQSTGKLDALFPGLAPENKLELDQFKSAFKVDQLINNSQTLNFDNLALRLTPSPGHTPESMAYLILPHNILVADQSFGYFRGRELAAPGADYNMDSALASMLNFKDTEFFALAFPYLGVLTGHLVAKHLAAVVQNTQDLRSEVKRAHTEKVSATEILDLLRASFFGTDSGDPLFKYVLELSLLNIWRQVQGKLQ